MRWPGSATWREHYGDVLRDIASSYIDEPGQRHALVSDALEALDDILLMEQQSEEKR